MSHKTLSSIFETMAEAAEYRGNIFSEQSKIIDEVTDLVTKEHSATCLDELIDLNNQELSILNKGYKILEGHQAARPEFNDAIDKCMGNLKDHIKLVKEKLDSITRLKNVLGGGKLLPNVVKVESPTIH